MEAPGKNLFVCDTDAIELIREINVFPRQLCWCNHWSQQTSTAFKIQLIPLLPEVQDSPRIIVHITDVCDAALQMWCSYYIFVQVALQVLLQILAMWSHIEDFC